LTAGLFVFFVFFLDVKYETKKNHIRAFVHLM